MLVRNSEEKIIETQSIRDMLQLISYDTWLLLDIDNTVMEPLHELGSDQWFVKLIEHACQLTSNKEEAMISVVKLYQEVQHRIRTKTVEPEIVHLVKALQDSGVPILALTARDSSLIQTTRCQLKDIGIDFSRCWYTSAKKIELDNEDKESNPTYSGGIIFCSGKDKGKCLNSLLTHTPKLPKHIVMVDDKEKHLLHVKEIIKRNGIRFHGLRYGFLDEKAKNVNMQAAHIQLACIKQELSSPVQNTIEQLQLVSSNVHIQHTKYAGFFRNLHHLKRKHNEPSCTNEKYDSSVKFSRN